MDHATFKNKIVLVYNNKCCKAQILIALSIYVLVAIVKKQLGIPYSLHTILQIFSLAIFELIFIIQVLSGFDIKDEIVNFPNQLLLFEI